MSGQYLKKVHACYLPEFDPGHGGGTIWQCECERVFIQTWRSEAYGILGGYAWRVVEARNWDSENLVEKPQIIEWQDLPLVEKKWWQF